MQILNSKLSESLQEGQRENKFLSKPSHRLLWNNTHKASRFRHHPILISLSNSSLRQLFVSRLNPEFETWRTWSKISVFEDVKLKVHSYASEKTILSPYIPRDWVTSLPDYSAWIWIDLRTISSPDLECWGKCLNQQITCSIEQVKHRKLLPSHNPLLSQGLCACHSKNLFGKDKRVCLQHPSGT